MTSGEIANKFNEDDNSISISSDTVIRRLQEKGLFAYVPKEKPQLSERNMKERLNWSRMYRLIFGDRLNGVMKLHFR